MLDVAILGISGIGKVHAKIFQSLGANVVAILSSTENNANLAAKQLLNEYGLAAKPYWNLNDLLEMRLDAVSICTPPLLHHSHILASFENEVAVFCEKPLFWTNGSSIQRKKMLHQLKSHRNRRLFMNISNSLFIDKIRERAPHPEDVEYFYFQFNTHGSNKDKNILIDLLPHGISLLQSFFGSRPIRNTEFIFDSNNVTTKFQYGNCSVKFDFQENQQCQKKFFFKINQNEYHRIQEVHGGSYSVFVMDVANNDKIELEDPFIVYISNFIEYCSNQNRNKKDNFQEAEINLILMNTLLNNFR